MTVKCSTKDQLATAIENDANDIVIVDVDLKNHVLRISAIGKVAWVVAIGSIALAVTLSLTAPGPGLVVGASCLTSAVGVMGVSTSSFAVALAVAAGGVGVLNKLRNYEIKENKDGSIRLTK